MSHVQQVQSLRGGRFVQVYTLSESSAPLGLERKFWWWCEEDINREYRFVRKAPAYHILLVNSLHPQKTFLLIVGRGREKLRSKEM